MVWLCWNMSDNAKTVRGYIVLRLSPVCCLYAVDLHYPLMNLDHPDGFPSPSPTKGYTVVLKELVAKINYKICDLYSRLIIFKEDFNFDGR